MTQRPLESRFPTLYHNIRDERDPATGNPVARRTPRPSPPTLGEVISTVLISRGVNDTAVAADLTGCVAEFIAGTSPVPAKPSSPLAPAPAPVPPSQNPPPPPVVPGAGN